MKKSIIILIPTLNIGGAETVLINFLNCMDHEKYSVTLYLAVNIGPLISKVPENVSFKYLSRNYFVYRVVCFLYAKYNFTFLIRLFSNKMKGKYDIAISFLDGINTDFLLFSKIKYGKIFSIVQSNYEKYSQKTKYLNSELGQTRVKRRYEKLDGVICVSKSVEEGFINVFGDTYKTISIYSPIMTSKLKIDKNKSLKFENNKVHIVALGRLVTVKGYENLIKAINIIVNESNNYNLKLRIIGTGELQDSLQTLIRNYSLEEFVELCGYVEDAYPLIEASDLFVMTSFSEGLPTALCEAMILGKPVMVTNVSGCSEVVSNGEYGAICEPNAASIAEVLGKLVVSPDLLESLKRKSLERAKMFSVDHAMDQYYKLFE
jgi:glycosyltransferase involved in cell wall biosynthesis